MDDHYYIGVDVGTSCVRAALFSQSGILKTVASKSIQILEPDVNYYEQSSDDIWAKCCQVIQLVTADVQKDLVKGIGFDATCSLVVLDTEMQPLSVSPTGENHWNIVMWMDHRAGEQADRINQSKHSVLKYVGGTMSLEMQTPKLLWLKENMKDSCWKQAGHFFDLPDYLTWKATGSLSRSLCSLDCKWTYQADEDGNVGFDANFFRHVDLEDLVIRNFEQIGTEVQSPGSRCGQGLTEAAAREMGLLPHTPVATSIIDAHAGGLGCLGCRAKVSDGDIDVDVKITAKLAMICGTSSCHMATSDQPLMVPGVWGPYYSAMVPGYWLNEGGQSASGKLIDHIIENHSAYHWLKDDAAKRQIHVHDVLFEVLEFMAKKLSVSDLDLLTHDLHIWPDYHGNRSPVADARLKGMVCGLTLSTGVEDLAMMYLATIQALAYGTRHIISSLNEKGHQIKLICACGGLAKNRLFIQTHANITGLPIILPQTPESVMLGAAILGAQASGDFESLQAAMKSMGGEGDVIKPRNTVESFHEKKMAVFLKMLKHQKEYRDVMAHS